MNFTTHVMFGIIVAALFFGKPEIILLVALGSAIPDLDREYGFLSMESFREHQVHRSLLHNFFFLAMLYLVNPFLALGAFLHTLLDAITTARDRGVEWLYPFTRFVSNAVYDSHGKRMKLDPQKKIYYNQVEPSGLSRETTADLKPDDARLLPWRRTYGPALSGRLFDEGVFVGSAALTLLVVILSALGIRQVVDLRFHPIDPSFAIPIGLALIGGMVNFVAGEIDRRRQIKGLDSRKLEDAYKGVFVFSIVILLSALVLGGLMNPQIALEKINEIPYIGAGIAVLALVAFIVLRRAASKPVDEKAGEPTII